MKTCDPGADLAFPYLVVAALYIVGRLAFPDLWLRF